MIVGQGDDIEAGPGQRNSRGGRGKERVALHSWKTQVADGSFEVGEGDIGILEEVRDRGERVL